MLLCGILPSIPLHLAHHPPLVPPGPEFCWGIYHTPPHPSMPESHKPVTKTQSRCWKNCWLQKARWTFQPSIQPRLWQISTKTHKSPWDFPGGRWWRLHASNVRNTSLIPDWGTKIPHTEWRGQKTEEKKDSWQSLDHRYRKRVDEHSFTQPCQNLHADCYTKTRDRGSSQVRDPSL